MTVGRMMALEKLNMCSNQTKMTAIWEPSASTGPPMCAALYLLINAFRGQLVVMHQEPHQIGRVDKRRLGHRGDGVVLEVKELDSGGDEGNGRQTPTVTVHGDGVGGGAVALFRTGPSGGVCLKGTIVLLLPVAAKQPAEGVVSVGETDWEKGGQEEDDLHGL